MNFLTFLKSKSVALCCIVFGVVCWSIVAAFIGVLPLFIGLSVAAVAAGVAVWLGLEYYFLRKRLDKLQRICNEIEEGYLLGEVFPRPVNETEEQYFAIMKFISRSAIGKIETLKREQEAYSDYVEKWIHEIKTPLTACSLILTNGGDIRKLKTQLKIADNLTENILYCARLRTLEADTQITQTGVRKIADGAVKSQMELLLAANVSVEVEGDFTVYTDAKALEFIIKQLLVNCSKYCKGCHLRICADDGVLKVEDEGSGIPPHELSRIFSRGFVGEAGRKHGGGTGMGLYLVYELCQKLNIDVSVQSEVGKYTRFIFSFSQSQDKLLSKDN